MPIIFYGDKLAHNLLTMQLLTFVLSSLMFGLKDITQGISALAGGFAVWLPNIVYLIFVFQNQDDKMTSSRIAWIFVLGEIVKVVLAVVLLIVVLGVFNAAFWPVMITCLALLAVQILAPVIFNLHHN